MLTRLYNDSGAELTITAADNSETWTTGENKIVFMQYDFFANPEFNGLLVNALDSGDLVGRDFEGNDLTALQSKMFNNWLVDATARDWDCLVCERLTEAIRDSINEYDFAGQAGTVTRAQTVSKITDMISLLNAKYLEDATENLNSISEDPTGNYFTANRKSALYSIFHGAKKP